jgi:putative OmpL-like beta-barrel porin-2/carboxypeptidase family protein
MRLNAKSLRTYVFVIIGGVGLLAVPPKAVAQESSVAEASQASMMRAAVRRVMNAENLPTGRGADESAPAKEASADPVLASSIVGTVHDPSDVAVTEAELTIKNLATDEILSSTSDASGAFSIQNLTPGSYEISARKSGFREADATIVVAASQRVHTDFRLKLATTVEDSAVSVTGAPDLDALVTRIEQLETELAALKASAGSPQAPSAPAQAAPAAPPPVDEQTPFAFGDFTWVNGGSRNKKVAFDSPFFTPEVRFDTHYLENLNKPIDHSIGGSTENFRSGEVQVEQASVGGDFHLDNVRGRILFMQGLFATTTPRNDGSAGVGQWDVRGAYKYVSEAYGGYHLDVQHGLNIDAGIFVSYIGLFSYYNFDNWTYQPSYVSSNTPWFFNGLRIQWFPTNKLKIEPWFINGWQSYNKFNGRPGMGGQILWTPTENVKLVFNNYFNGTDTLGAPNRRRFHTDDSFLLRYYHHPEKTGISQMAMSFTADFGCEKGDGVVCTGGNATTPSQYFAGWMVYDHIWFHNDLFAITPGGGVMSNPGRYLTLLPPINGADAISGSPYFLQNPGSQANMWDATLNFQYYPREFLTFWWEAGYRHSDIPYFSGRGGITPPGGNNGFPQYFACSTGASSGATDLASAQTACGGGAGSVWFPDLRKNQTIFSMGVLVKF